jgi:hypothetical protein
MSGPAICDAAAVSFGPRPYPPKHRRRVWAGKGAGRSDNGTTTGLINRYHVHRLVLQSGGCRRAGGVVGDDRRASAVGQQLEPGARKRGLI